MYFNWGQLYSLGARQVTLTPTLTLTLTLTITLTLTLSLECTLSVDDPIASARGRGV